MEIDHPTKKPSNFFLDKWYLDFVGGNGEAMIFYSAKMKWHNWQVSYSSWLNYDPQLGVSQNARFRNVQAPKKTGNTIKWIDQKFGLEGIWEAMEKPLEARLFNSENGYLDWACYQPVAKVQLNINGKKLEGNGYAEQLILTAPPWEIPMHELRWGRFISEAYNIVWIEIREKNKKQWIWLNGENAKDAVIEDDYITLLEKDFILKNDRGVALESERKIFSVVKKIVQYIPGFNKIIPFGFLMADEFKWLSKSELLKNEKTISTGSAIHELVRFKYQ